MMSVSPQTRFLVTSALPYANGSLHLGHLLEHVLTDVYVRALKLTHGARAVLYVCGDDTHGAPIQINAQKKGMAPDAFVALFEQEHQRDFKRYQVCFDGYYSTHHDTNRQLVEQFYHCLEESHLLLEKTIEQFYCVQDARFLPDRFVRGTCPKCKTTDQYGDVCEQCGTTYGPEDLIDPRCALCTQTPVKRTASHVFVDLEKKRAVLESWLNQTHSVQPEVRHFIEGWLKEDLKSWCITRDGPYFGFLVPGRQQYFYVWLDAPIGYIAASLRACLALGLNFADFWQNKECRVIHVIGKDIVYFHTLFWPAMLSATPYSMPYHVQVHGMLKVNGEKMSKSRGTSISAHDFAEVLDPQYFRYYLASKVSHKIEDVDLSSDEFVLKVNAELINKIVNLVSRSVSFLNRSFGSTICYYQHQSACALAFSDRVRPLIEQAMNAFSQFNLAAAVSVIVRLADMGNAYFQGENPFTEPPWVLQKTNQENAQCVASVTLSFCQVIAILLQPVMPELAQKIIRVLGLKALNLPEEIIGCQSFIRFDLATMSQLLPPSHVIAPHERLLDRIEDSQVLNRLIEALRMRQTESESSLPVSSVPSLPVQSPVETSHQAAEFQPIKDRIEYAHFAALDLRACKILNAERVPKSDKLLKLSVDVGEPQSRQVIAGIGLAYEPAQLVGKTVVCLANLKPAKIMGQESQAMLLAAGPGGSDIVLLDLPTHLPAGSMVK